MRRVRSRDTAPEMLVRKAVYAMGFRYRLYAKDLPGTPDMVFRARRKIIFVHGCFWHRHLNCSLARLPKSRLDFWSPKLESNRQRDQKNVHALRDMGWSVLTVWECELGDLERLKIGIKEFLDGKH